MNNPKPLNLKKSPGFLISESYELRDNNFKNSNFDGDEKLVNECRKLQSDGGFPRQLKIKMLPISHF